MKLDNIFAFKGNRAEGDQKVSKPYFILLKLVLLNKLCLMCFYQRKVIGQPETVTDTGVHVITASSSVTAAVWSSLCLARCVCSQLLFKTCLLFHGVLKVFQFFTCLSTKCHCE